MRALLAIFLAVGLAPVSHAQTGPDVIVGQLNGIANYQGAPSAIGMLEAFSVGTTSCNVGDAVLLWESGTSAHPVIGQNLYKLKHGVLTQIGQSWLKHGFCALSQTLCGPCSSTPCETLGVGCSDPYTAIRNGTQSTLGPRSQVNPSTGEFPYPFTAPSPPDDVGRRLQVPVSLLETASAGAQYFIDGQYITEDDTAAGNHMNNVSICQVTMLGAGSQWSASMNPLQTVTERNVIEHWATIDAQVELSSVITDAGSGRIWIASKVIEDNGEFRYEYAVYNENSHDAVGTFGVAMPLGLSIDPSFHAVHHHSGSGPTEVPGVDPSHPPFGDVGYTNEPWSFSEETGFGVGWSTASTAEPANPIRWGTMYNFRFVTNAPPVAGEATVSTWRNGESYLVPVSRPTDDFVPAVTDLHCEYDLIEDAATITWVNAAPYTELRLFRGAQLVATLPGDAEGHVDSLAVPGEHQYTVVAVDASQLSAEVSCVLTVPTQALNFAFRFASTSLYFDAATGSGAATTAINVAEDPDNIGFPHDVAGFSMAFTYDPALLTVGSVVAAQPLEDLEPDFMEVSILEDSGVPTGGVTVGVVVDFLIAPPFLVAVEEVPVLLVTLETIPEAASETITEVWFEDGVHGAIPISNIVTVSLQSYPALSVPGQVFLEPATEVTFRRGDTNADGILDLADPIFDLIYQTSGGPAYCLSAHDVNDDGAIDLDDVLHGLTYQFLDGPPIAAPSPGCGIDGTVDSLGCETTNCP